MCTSTCASIVAPFPSLVLWEQVFKRVESTLNCLPMPLERGNQGHDTNTLTVHMHLRWFRRQFLHLQIWLEDLSLHLPFQSDPTPIHVGKASPPRRWCRRSMLSSRGCSSTEWQAWHTLVHDVSEPCIAIGWDRHVHPWTRMAQFDNHLDRKGVSSPSVAHPRREETLWVGWVGTIDIVGPKRRRGSAWRRTHVRICRT